MAELIASGTAQADSADFSLTAGQSATLFLKDATGPLLTRSTRALVQIKSADSVYFTIGELTHDEPAQVLTAVGTFRVRKLASGTAFGVDKV